ncbi:UNVERIFIED_CONTAM: hypothetical protein RKD43_007021 [Streptomyces graminofaciens]
MPPHRRQARAPEAVCDGHDGGSRSATPKRRLELTQPLSQCPSHRRRPPRQKSPGRTGTHVHRWALLPATTRAAVHRYTRPDPAFRVFPRHWGVRREPASITGPLPEMADQLAGSRRRPRRHRRSASSKGGSRQELESQADNRVLPPARAESICLFTSCSPVFRSVPRGHGPNSAAGTEARPYDDHVTIRRNLGTGPEAPAHIHAAQADLLDTLPGVRLPDLNELRARGTLGVRPTASPSPRRGLGTGAEDAEPLR